MIKQAFWIGYPDDYGSVCPEFLKEFSVVKQVKQAMLSITAIGVYEAFLNGERIGNFVLTPGCTAYRTRLQYQSYDVTALLKQANKLSVSVGSGWYRGRYSAALPELHDKPCAMLAALQICYEDGTKETVFSDESWQVRKSRILFSDIFDGELYDASKEEEEFQPVIVHDLDKNCLISQEGEAVCEQQFLKPIRMFITPKGERVLDFGQNLAGYISFGIHAKKGEQLIVSHGETLDTDGNFYNGNYNHATPVLTYICCDGFQTYKPHFTFYGFRYIRLDCAPETISADDFTAIAIYSDMRRNGHLVCDNQAINKLYENVLWSQRSNFIDFPTDCPQRDERAGWLGDAQIFAKTACYNYNTLKFFSKWLGDVRAEQFSDGSIPNVVPNLCGFRRSSAGWGDVITILPWQLYQMYGDKKILSDNFDAMRRWVDYITADTLDAFLWTCKEEQKVLWGKHYGDWLALDNGENALMGATDIDLIASAFYAHSTELVVKAGTVLGYDMEEYQTLYRNIVQAFQKRYPEFDTQTGCALALSFHLTSNPKKTAKQLVELIQKNGNKLNTGFIGTPYLLQALSSNGYTDIAYELLLQTEYPSWLYPLQHGATTVWEHWGSIAPDGTFCEKLPGMNSLNHYAYGAVVGWLYTVAAGINPDEKYPGFERAVICPQASERLGWLRCSYESAHGMFISGWTVSETEIKYEITTPVPARILLGKQTYDVMPGNYIFYEKN